MEDLSKNSPKVVERVEVEKSGPGLLVWVMAGIVLGLTVANGFLFHRTNQLESQIGRMQNATVAELASLREHESRSNLSVRQTLDEVRTQMQENTARADLAASRARSVSQKHAEKLIHTLAEENKAREAQFTQAIGEVKQAAQGTDAKVTEIVTEVGSVKGEVAQTKSTLETTLTDLKSVRGDMGVQSGLIATNSKELAALRELGERNYMEFTFAKSNKPQKIGNILVALKKTDAKRNKYTLEVIADDRKVEKKDKYINEPVQFYVQGARLPYEIVVNEVHKDKVVGYLATPKVVQARR
jgi:hypothetical protein